MSIGSRIKEQRNLHGLTQPELAIKLEMSLDSIKKLETDRVKPSIETLSKLSDVFNCSSDYLLGIEISKNDEVITWSKLVNDLRGLDILTGTDIDEILKTQGNKEIPKETLQVINKKLDQIIEDLKGDI